MRSSVLLLVLSFAGVLLVSAPALSQTSQGGPSAAGSQYDGGSSVGDRAAQDALMASGAIRATAEEAQATETDSVSASDLPSVSSDLDAASAVAGNTGTSSESPSASAGAGESQDEIASTGEAQDESAKTGGWQDESASAADVPGEIATVSDLEKLPDTGGPSPLWIGLPLVCAGGLITRRVFSN